MKVLIIVKSKHNDNTLKIAEAMSEAAPVTLTELENVKSYNLNEYDIVGFGSGIYYGKHDRELISYVESLDDNKNYCFVFSTSGSGNYDKNNKHLVKLLERKNKVVLDTFGCRGLDKFFVFALLGGLNKGHPDTDDFDASQDFILKVIEKYNQLKT